MYIMLSRHNENQAQAGLKIMKTTEDIHSWCDTYVATETSGLFCITSSACTRTNAKEQGNYTATLRC
jgi:hypothetical protein